MIIYKTTNLINGKIYIGKDANDNPYYLGSGVYLNRAIKKYGKRNFIKEQIETCDGDNWEEREMYWIEKLGSRNVKIGYNASPGGEGFRSGKEYYLYDESIPKEKRDRFYKCRVGRFHSDESKRKMSEAHKGKVYSEEYKLKMSESIKKSKKFKECHNSNTYKEKMRVLNLGINNPMYGSHNTGVDAPNYGHHHSEETKKKISESCKKNCVPPWKGKHLPDYFKKKLSLLLSGKNNPFFGRTHSTEARKKMSDSHKRSCALKKLGIKENV